MPNLVVHRAAQRLAALAQSGLTYATDPFDVERYDEVRRLAASLLALGEPACAADVADLLANESGYATPKIDVRAAIFDGERILLVRERSDGKWTVPGGWADVGESAAECVVREVREESGFESVATKLLALLDKNKHEHPPQTFHTYKAFFRCERIGGAASGGVETSEADFFAENDLPPLSTTRVTLAQVRRLFVHLRRPELPTDFD